MLVSWIVRGGLDIDGPFHTDRTSSALVGCMLGVRMRDETPAKARLMLVAK